MALMEEIKAGIKFIYAPTSRLEDDRPGKPIRLLKDFSAGRVFLLILFFLFNLNASLAEASKTAETRSEATQKTSTRPLVIKAGRILTMTGPALENGIIIVEDGRIKAVGQGLSIPEGAEIIEEPEGWVLPGLIDAHSSLGLADESGRSESEELSEPDVAQLSVVDGIYPFDKNIVRARAAGITSALVSPGRRSVIGGQMAVVRLQGRNVEEMVMQAPARYKSSIGEGPKQAYGEKGRLPSNRMGNVFVIMQAPVEA